VGLGLGATTVPQAAPQKLDGNRSIDLPPRGGLPEPEADEGEVVLQGSGDDVHLVAGPSATYTNHGAASSSDTKGATDLYATAQSRMKEGKFKDALSAYQEVLDRFPKHRLADNAMYWAGWCEQQGKDHKGAIAVWQKLPLRFPKSAKVADSLYGMALSHEALGEAAEAETLYREIVAQYPKAEAWKNAKKALARLHPGTDP
jgi:tol-pal system protein YbgF